MRSEQHEAVFRRETRHWWYKTRRDLVHDLIRRYRPHRKELHIADIGCGAGALTKEMERYGTCVGIDASDQSLSFCRERGVKEVRAGTAENTSLPPETIDVVTCLDVLEHIPNDILGIREIKRILRKDSVAIIFVPTFMFLWSGNDDVSQHFRRYHIPELREKFSQEGFEILKDSYFNTLLFPVILTARFAMRILNIKRGGEVDMGNSLTDAVLYRIFSLEIPLLRFLRFPFGVSGMLVVRKK